MNEMLAFQANFVCLKAFLMRVLNSYDSKLSGRYRKNEEI